MRLIFPLGNDMWGCLPPQATVPRLVLQTVGSVATPSLRVTIQEGTELPLQVHTLAQTNRILKALITEPVRRKLPLPVSVRGPVAITGSEEVVLEQSSQPGSRVTTPTLPV